MSALFAGALLAACIGGDDATREEGNFMQPATGERDGGTPSARDGGARDAQVAPVSDGGAPEDTSVAPVDGETDPLDGAADAGDEPVRDAGGDADVPVDGGCAGLFCEDFEQGALDQAVWTRVDTDDAQNRVEVQSAVVAHGRGAAHFYARGGSSRAVMFNEAIPAALRAHYFGRMNVRIRGFPTENGGHTAYVTGGHSLAGYPYSDDHLEVGHYYTSARPIWQLTYWTGDGPEYISTGGRVPVDTWFCLEWEFNNAPNQIAVWVDGKDSPDGAAFRNINGNSSGLLTSLATLGIGFRTFHPSGAPDTDVYVDDLVLDTVRVPCLP